MPARVVVLGGGVGGTLVANLLDKALGRDASVTVVDPTGMHVYQPGLLYVALGEANGRWLVRDERTLLRPNVELAVDAATFVDTSAGTVSLARDGSIPFDYLVLATGARLDPGRVPGLTEAAHDFYSFEGALRLREALRGFKGGKIAIGVAGIPYKCPPAPIEFSLMLEDELRKRGIREHSEIAYLSPINRAFTIESASKVVQPIMERRGIDIETFFNVESVDPAAHTVTSLEGDKKEYDLLVLVPPHRGQEIIEKSQLGGPGGWVPTNAFTLQHESHANIFALGDATNLPISKSGSTAHFEAPVVASRIASFVRNTEPRASYGGRVMCFLETGGRRSTALRFDYEHPPIPPKPSLHWHIAKWMFNRLYWNTVPQGRIPERLGHAKQHRERRSEP